MMTKKLRPLPHLAFSPQKGVVNLLFLAVMGGLLAVYFLLDDGKLGFYAEQAMLHKSYAAQSLAAQHQARQQKADICRNLSLETDERSKTVAVSSAENHGESDILAANVDNFAEDRRIYALWCRKLRLFFTPPTEKLYAERLSELIDQREVAAFRSTFQLNLPRLNSKAVQIYWFDSDHQQAEITGTINGIVIAEGGLHLTGKGKISGAVITGGKFSAEPSVTVAYSKKNVTQLYRQYSRWLLAEKSWHDFQTE